MGTTLTPTITSPKRLSGLQKCTMRKVADSVNLGGRALRRPRRGVLNEPR